MKTFKYLILGIFVWTHYCAYNWEENWKAELDTESPIVTAYPIPKTVIAKLSELELVFSEKVTGAESISNYVLSGPGTGSLNIDEVQVLEDQKKFRVKFTGKISDGVVELQLQNIYDMVRNPLKNPILEWMGDGEPKWRYLQRKMSRGFIGVNQIPMVKDGDYLYIAYSDESCQGQYGFSDATVIRYHIATNTYEILGEPCIIKTVEAASNITSLIVYYGTPIVAFRDTSDSVINGKISVKKLGPNGWEYLGSPGFSPNPGLSPELFYYQNRIYVTFRDQANSSRLRIYYIDLNVPNPNWQELPPGGLLSASNPFRNVPAVLQGNRFYFAFRESTNILKINYYDLGNSQYAGERIFNSISNIDTVQVVPQDQYIVVQYSYVQTTRRIKLRYYDNTPWSSSTWPDLVPELDLGVSSAANNLQCGFRAQTPFCVYNLGTGNLYTQTWNGSHWVQVVSPGKSDSAINGGNPSLVISENALYLAIRDRDVGYNNTLALLSYE